MSDTLFQFYFYLAIPQKELFISAFDQPKFFARKNNRIVIRTDESPLFIIIKNSDKKEMHIQKFNKTKQKKTCFMSRFYLRARGFLYVLF